MLATRLTPVQNQAAKRDLARTLSDRSRRPGVNAKHASPAPRRRRRRPRRWLLVIVVLLAGGAIYGGGLARGGRHEAMAGRGELKQSLAILPRGPPPRPPVPRLSPPPAGL